MTILSKFRRALVGLAVAVAIVLGCTPAQRQEAKTVAQDALSAEQVACAIAKDTGASDLAPVLTACGIAQPLLPAVQTILAAHRAAPASSADGGAP